MIIFSFLFFGTVLCCFVLLFFMFFSDCFVVYKLIRRWIKSWKNKDFIAVEPNYEITKRNRKNGTSCSPPLTVNIRSVFHTWCSPTHFRQDEDAGTYSKLLNGVVYRRSHFQSTCLAAIRHQGVHHWKSHAHSV